MNCPACGHADLCVRGCDCDCRYEIEHAALTEALDALEGMVRRDCVIRVKGESLYAALGAEDKAALALLTRHGRMREVEPVRFVFTTKEDR